MSGRIINIFCLILILWSSLDCVHCSMFATTPKLTSNSTLFQNHWITNKLSQLPQSAELHRQLPSLPTNDLHWIPWIKDGDTNLMTSERQEGFFARIRQFFHEFRTDPPKAVINAADLFLGRLGEAAFHAIVEMILDFILGFSRGRSCSSC